MGCLPAQSSSTFHTVPYLTKASCNLARLGMLGHPGVDRSSNGWGCSAEEGKHVSAGWGCPSLVFEARKEGDGGLHRLDLGLLSNPRHNVHELREGLLVGGDVSTGFVGVEVGE